MGDQDQAHVRASLPVWRVLQFGRFGSFRQSGCDNYYAAALAAEGLNGLVPKAGTKTFLAWSLSAHTRSLLTALVENAFNPPDARVVLATTY
jgi:hypothetical protein